MFRTSIRNKLIAFLLAAVTVPLATSIIITYWYTKDSIAKERIGVTAALLVQGRENIRHYMDTIHQATLSVYNDAKLNEAIETGATDYLSDKETYRALMHMANVMPDIYQVYLYLDLAKQPYLLKSALFKRIPESPQPFRPDTYGAEVAVQPPHASHDYGFAPTAYIEPATVMTMHRIIRRVPRTEELGILSVDVDMQGLRTMAESLYDRSREQLFLIDERGYVVYGPDPGDWGRRLEQGWAAELLARPERAGSVFVGGGDGFRGVQVYDTLETSYLRWTIVKRIPDEALYKQARDVARINTFVLAAFSLLSIVVTVGVAFLFTAPIKRLIGYIAAIEKGNMNVDIRLSRSDEFGLLAARFRSMMQHINNLIVKEYRLELANRTNQLKALQAQIQPHFLYNALQSIGTLALQMNAPNVYKLIASLGKMMRYSMNTGETSVPLAKEIDHIRSYMELQRNRFGDGLALTLDIDEQTLQVEVPKMTLQPLVENYFKHGMVPSPEQPGEIEVRSRALQDGTIAITVRDNGRGAEPARLERVRRTLRLAGKGLDPEAEDADGGGIGLANVLSRLKLFYGDEADMQVEGAEPHGFRITITIPARGKEADDEDHHRG
ncbi:sensor histidine kinase [Paenibacillus ginsengarvi]|uniref:histidine kinase n=1 Tax=Paenibacillus ginsengarvi TaxID=400777 RepID=A0A3B0CMY0_9BACL|nr:histidine kinase [Paenibacillus ginsengarvi]RKN85629.1 sensor histidine kinase [Paenibacillus ginsengarvi]